MNGTDGLLWKSALGAERAPFSRIASWAWSSEKTRVIDRADEKRDTLLMCGELCPVQAGMRPKLARIGLV